MKGKLKRSVTVAVLSLGLFVTGISAPTSAISSDNVKARVVEFYSKAPLSFEARQGQADGGADFSSRGNGYTIFISPAEASLVLRNEKPSDARRAKSTGTCHQADMVTMKIVGAKTTAKSTAIDPLPGKVNYFIGNDPKRWRTKVSTYGRVKYENVYRGVDLIYHGNQRQLEFDFIVAPGANPDSIALKFEGAAKLELDAQGNLVATTASGQKIVERKPVIYQEANGERQEVPGGYVLAENYQVGFQIASYDQTKPLIIDPTLTYATYLGGRHADLGQGGIAVDSQGNFYVGGQTVSTDFPPPPPPLPTAPTRDLPGQSRPHGPNPLGKDGFVTKFNADGTIAYSIYLGAMANDPGGGTQVSGVAIDADDSVCLVGTTECHGSIFPSSLEFPTTSSAYKPHKEGVDHDAFVMKLATDIDGNISIKYSTLFGGPDDEDGHGIAVNSDSHRTICITGTTHSSQGIVPASLIPTAFQPTWGGNNDAFVAKFDPTKAGAASLIYSTYIGGSGNEQIFAVGFTDRYAGGIAVDGAGNAYVIGSTDSTDDFLKPPAGSFKQLHAAVATGTADFDAFVIKFDHNGNRLAATYLGGSNPDYGVAIAVDGFNNLYVTGRTRSVDFGVTPTHLKGFDFNVSGKPLGPDLDGVFVAKLDSDLTKLLYATYLGPGVGASIAVDCANNAYVTGNANEEFPNSSQLPTSGGTGVDDSFVAVLNANGDALTFSTRMGGSKGDTGSGIAVANATGKIYVAGTTSATAARNTSTLPANQPTPGGGGDAFVAIIAADHPPCQSIDCCTNYWRLDGNAGTTAGPNFLGTTDNNPLELKVDGVRALRLEPIPPPDQSGLFSTGINVIGGSESNSAASGVYGATIAGGGNTGASEFDQPEPNTVNGNYGTIGGGLGNTSIGFASTVGGGEGNSAVGRDSVIGGGEANTAKGSGSVIGGGGYFGSNSDSDPSMPNKVNGNYGTIGGGLGNTSIGFASTVGGGEGNTASGTGSVIGGGGHFGSNSDSDPSMPNKVDGNYGTIGGGLGNTSIGFASTVGGGEGNTASGTGSVIGGGGYVPSDPNNPSKLNIVTGDFGTIGGGLGNSAVSYGSTIGGGDENATEGYASVVPGGDHNVAIGGSSLAAGHYAKASSKGTFVWADSSVDEHFEGSLDNQFLIRAVGGVGIGVNDVNSGIDASDPLRSSLDVKGRLRLRDDSNGHTAGIWLRTKFLPNATIEDIGFIGAVDSTRIGFWGNDPRGRGVPNKPFNPIGPIGWGLTFDTFTGNVGIGMNDRYVNMKLEVNGDIACSGNYLIRNPDGTYTVAFVGGSGGDDVVDALHIASCIFNPFSCWSDERLKEGITTIPRAVEELEKLRGVTFHWNDTGLRYLTRNITNMVKSASGKPEDDRKLWHEKRRAAYEALSKTQIGFIAQEVEKVFPDWVSTDDQGYKRINMERLNAVLVNAIKEQQAQIEAQQKEIVELKVAQNRAAADWETRFKKLEKSVARIEDKSAATPPGSR
jgi:hypothetical protein